MAEAIALAASIIAVLQISEHVIKFCKHYIESVQDAPSELHTIFLEISTLRAVFEGLDLLIKPEKSISSNLRSLAGDDGSVAGCARCVSALEEVLGARSGTGVQSRRDKAKDMLKSLAWPLKEGKVKRLLGEILQYKTSITLALSSESAHDIKRVDSKLDQLRAANRSREDQSVLDWLTPIDHGSQQCDFITRQQEGTGKWLLESTEFHDWLKADQQTFFCPGIPGAGKTIITAAVINELLTRFGADPSVGIAWIYCNFRQTDEQTVENMLMTLLKALSGQRPSLPGLIKDLYKQKMRMNIRPSLAEISNALLVVATSYSRVFIVVDALDELADEPRRMLLSKIFDLQEKCRANLFATSRFITEIQDRFKGSISKEIRATGEDIQRYLDGYVPRLGKFVVERPELQKSVCDTIIEAVDGMFLLAQLHLKALTGKRSPKAFRQALEKIATRSGGYDAAYNDVMERITNQETDHASLAMDTLSWITCTKTPLSTSQLRHALAIETGEPELDEENLPDIETIISTCAGLVTVDEQSDVIRLVHYTAQEYFRQTWTTWFPDAHALITKACVTYLSFDVFESGPCDSYFQFENRLEEYDLYDYASRNWGHHAHNVHAGVSEEVRDLCVRFLEQVNKTSASGQAMMITDAFFVITGPKKMSGLHISALFGLSDVTAVLLKRGCNPNHCDSHGRTPLHLAALKGHNKVAQLLLEAHAGTEAKATYITVDSDRGFHPQFDISDRADLAPLHWAAANGHKDIVKLLLDRGANISSRTGAWKRRTAGGQTPLHLAARQGYLDVCELLLGMGADISDRDAARGAVALHYAAHHGHVTVIQLLLRKGVDVNENDYRGRTALHEAAQYGHYDVARLLIEKGADVEATTVRGWGATVLLVAAPHERIVGLLIEMGVDVSRKVGSTTALHYMAELGNVGAIRLMLENGADIEEKDPESRGRTPLLLAAFYGKLEAVRFLILAGADIYATDSRGYTALDEAYEGYGGNKRDSVIQLLQEAGAVRCQVGTVNDCKSNP
ncbi:ankyrin repeat-containing domain protein [Cladorrhinum sp. PSN259]|nr:ankyrin repeat-containing domain protein [Cladorrhinum sp. PSN259]